MQWLNKLRGARTNPAAPTVASDALGTSSVSETVASLENIPSDDPNFVDVRQLIQTLSLEELCQTAEDYFRDIPNPMHLVAKPFRDPIEVPHHLIRFSQVI